MIKYWSYKEEYKKIKTKSQIKLETPFLKGMFFLEIK